MPRNFAKKVYFKLSRSTVKKLKPTSGGKRKTRRKPYTKQESVTLWGGGGEITKAGLGIGAGAYGIGAGIGAARGFYLPKNKQKRGKRK